MQLSVHMQILLRVVIKQTGHNNKKGVAVFNQHDPLSYSYLLLVRSALPQRAFAFLTVWPLPGDRGTRRRCSASSSHPSPLLKASHRPEWLKRKCLFQIAFLYSAHSYLS